MTFDPKPFVEGLTAANRRERAAIIERARRAMDEARRLAEKISAADESVNAVYLFGSLAEGEPTRLDFDIDLALEGGDVYRAMGVTEHSDFSVDLVELRLLPPYTRERILAHGVVLVRR